LNIIIFLILGFLTSLLFPPYFFYPLGFIIFPFLCLFIENKINNYNFPKLFIYFFSFGFMFFFSLLFWLQNPFYVFEETKNYFYLTILLISFLSLVFTFIFTIILNYKKYIPTFFIIPHSFYFY
jgi:Apolipoprotein N-acyltransferase